MLKYSISLSSQCDPCNSCRLRLVFDRDQPDTFVSVSTFIRRSTYSIERVLSFVLPTTRMKRLAIQGRQVIKEIGKRH